jgi:hypothetical protein
MSVVPVPPQDLEQPRRQHHIAILTIFTLIHANHHALAINIGDLQVHDFRHAQPGRVGGHQDRALLEAGDRLEEGGDLRQAQDGRQSERLPATDTTSVYQRDRLVSSLSFMRLKKASGTRPPRRNFMYSIIV